jgi:hypothetical protein
MLRRRSVLATIVCLGVLFFVGRGAFIYIYNYMSVASDGGSPSISNYYAQLEKTVDLSLKAKREHGDVHALAVHRGLGAKIDTTEHYRLIEEAIVQAHRDFWGIHSGDKRLMDAGCGMGAGMLFFGRKHKNWVVDGYTIAESQFEFINKHLKNMLRGDLWLSSYNEPRREYDAIYAIESLWYTPSLDLTLGIW